MKYLIIITVTVCLLSCYGPLCEYQEMCSCEIYTDGNKRYATLMVKGCHLCCWRASFVIPEGMTEAELTEKSKKFYWDIVEENPECKLEGEDCGASWAYGLDIDTGKSKRKDF